LTYDGIPLKPAWAASVAYNLAWLPVIDGVRSLIVLADNDISGTGQWAADMVYNCWKGFGCDVTILTPKQAGTDFNDLAKSHGA
jgi:hypothetical protein